MIPFYLGLGSRYSYLAASQLARIERATGCRFDWRPLSSPELIRAANGGRSPFDPERRFGQYREAYRHHDAGLWAQLYAIPYREPRLEVLDPRDMAIACWLAEKIGQREALCRACLNAVFAEGRPMDRQVVITLGMSVGLTKPALEHALDDPRRIAAHQAVIDEALGLGVFGVPSFVIDGQVFWGNDRLPLVEHRLSRSA